MKNAGGGYRVAMVGSSSFLGKELLAQLEERRFPVRRLVTFDDELEEPELPIVDLAGGEPRAVAAESVGPGDLDFAFVAAPVGRLPGFLQRLDEKGWASQGSKCSVIDLSGRLRPSKEAPVRIPRLERAGQGGATGAISAQPSISISPHGATIALSFALLRLAAQFEIERITAHVFCPASELGARAIDELQKQTIHLLSFQKIPEEIYGGQLAFNLLPRRAGREHPNLEDRLRRELEAYLSGRAPMPSLRTMQAPMFYSLGISLYVEMRKTVTPAAAEAALTGAPVKISKAAEAPPSPAGAAGGEEILLDRVRADASHPNGLWVWAAADPLRLAAVNAIETAESLGKGARL